MRVLLITSAAAALSCQHSGMRASVPCAYAVLRHVVTRERLSDDMLRVSRVARARICHTMAFDARADSCSAMLRVRREVILRAGSYARASRVRAQSHHRAMLLRRDAAVYYRRYRCYMRYARE